MSAISTYMSFLAPAMAEMQEMKKKNEEKIEQILAEWRETKNYPRKKKKLARKHLQLDYSLFKHFQDTMFPDFDLFN